MTSPRQAIISSISEADFQRQVIELALWMGWKVHHTRPAQYQSGRWATPIQGQPGFPDLVLARGGVVIFAELKSAKGRLSEDQRSWVNTLPNAYVWRPSDIEEIKEILS